MTWITKESDDWGCSYIYVDKTSKEISCLVVDYDYGCKIIKNTSNLFKEECQDCDGNERYIYAYEYSVSGDILTEKYSRDNLDGSDIEEETLLYRRTTRTLESFECN